MDKNQKKRIRKYISYILLVALVAALSAMPLLAKQEKNSDAPVASILSGTVEMGNISTSIHGGGILAAQENVDVIIPTGVKITEFLVSNRETVFKGDPLAAVDRVTVMTTISDVQETMDYLIEKMADITEESASTNVSAKAGGLVKIIYAQAGDSVQDVMLKHGALAVISLDGLMAVEINRNTDLTTGNRVNVYLDNDTQVTGRVESNMDGILEITIEDDGYDVGQKVVVTTEDGQRLGSGELYVHNAWNAVAYTGTVSKVNTSINKTVRDDTTLLTLKDTDFNAELESLLSQYQDYEALMLELFQMYQSTVITAPCDGVISGVDTDSIHLLSADNTSYTISLLANAPNGDDSISYVNFVGMVTGISDLGAWNLAMNPDEFAILDYLDLSGVNSSTEAMTAVGAHIPTKPIYEYVDGAWVTLSPMDISIGDKLIFAHSEATGEPVWVIRISRATPPTDTDPTEPSGPPVPGEPSEPTNPGETPTEPTTPGETPEDPSNPSQGQTPGGMGGMGGFGNMSGMGGMGGYFGGTTQETFQLFDLEGSILLSVTPQETITLAVSIDEHVISKIQLGMSAQVQITALKNQTFNATVTEIGNTGTNNGGSSKFTVELTMEHTSDMLGGMTAVVTIPMTTTQNISVIPVSALVEKGSKTYVYTGYDEKQQSLTELTEVTLGVSDGIHVQVLSGLNEGDTYWYAYYDTLEIDTTAKSDSGFFGSR